MPAPNTDDVVTVHAYLAQQSRAGSILEAFERVVADASRAPITMQVWRVGEDVFTLHAFRARAGSGSGIRVRGPKVAPGTGVCAATFELTAQQLRDLVEEFNNG